MGTKVTRTLHNMHFIHGYFLQKLIIIIIIISNNKFKYSYETIYLPQIWLTWPPFSHFLAHFCPYCKIRKNKIFKICQSDLWNVSQGRYMQHSSILACMVFSGIYLTCSYSCIDIAIWSLGAYTPNNSYNPIVITRKPRFSKNYISGYE